MFLDKTEVTMKRWMLTVIILIGSWSLLTLQFFLHFILQHEHEQTQI